MYRQAIKQPPSSLGKWLLDYVASRQLSLTELSRLAGLSGGTLRSLVYYPDRLPSLETCVRLAKATGHPANKLLQLAGIAETGADNLDPLRVDLLCLYDRLSPSQQRMLVMIAEALQKFNLPVV
jgi:hypothetical protein